AAAHRPPLHDQGRSGRRPDSRPTSTRAPDLPTRRSCRQAGPRARASQAHSTRLALVRAACVAPAVIPCSRSKQEAVAMRTWRSAALPLLFLPALLAAQAPDNTDTRVFYYPKPLVRTPWQPPMKPVTRPADVTAQLTIAIVIGAVAQTP